jgi:hypothetical protein
MEVHVHKWKYIQYLKISWHYLRFIKIIYTKCAWKQILYTSVLEICYFCTDRTVQDELTSLTNLILLDQAQYVIFQRKDWHNIPWPTSCCVLCDPTRCSYTVADSSKSRFTLRELRHCYTITQLVVGIGGGFWRLTTAHVVSKRGGEFCNYHTLLLALAPHPPILASGWELGCLPSGQH